MTEKMFLQKYLYIKTQFVPCVILISKKVTIVTTHCLLYGLDTMDCICNENRTQF